MTNDSLHAYNAYQLNKNNDSCDQYLYIACEGLLFSSSFSLLIFDKNQVFWNEVLLYFKGKQATLTTPAVPPDHVADFPHSLFTQRSLTPWNAPGELIGER